MSKRHKEKKRSNRDIQEIYRQRQRLDAKAVDLCPHGTPWDKPCEECFRLVKGWDIDALAELEAALPPATKP